MQHIVKHLRQDPVLVPLLKALTMRPPRTESDVYLVLLRSIVGQQLSTKAAQSIWQRFLDVFPEQQPIPSSVLETSKEALRACGLSAQKSGYLQNIARFALQDDLSDTHLQTLSDEEALKHLCQIKGVGRWTAEMILMFALGRPDVFPVDDLGIRHAMTDLYGLTSEKRQLTSELESIASAWSPYRTYVCNLLWDWKDGK